ncbi:hypothetical protein CAL12_17930 [Bordetella genomosp. 8]|uniref:DUF924 domain-containing protein n=1 Tax=Bordetella genomosp. 8 TaxID=1416806 RepID=A0A1W6YU49_9BORD|nr:DUF924 family protein [Bordetella genomosp. 8]ARP84607.1 hypothetical protein CAL12_17930 [Bordetella genomosp. 8]
MSNTQQDLPTDAAAVLEFWKDAGPRKWFAKDAAFDAAFSERFAALHLAAARRALDHWAATAPGVLALLVLLDQYPRNAYRGTAHMYATDPLARFFARQAVEQGLDRQVEAGMLVFFYLPFEHSEDPDDQALSVQLAQRLDARSRDFAILHRDIIARFGRFPHRNALLGRVSTAQEQAFLEQGGFAG